MTNQTLPPKIEPTGNLVAVFPILNFIAFPKTIVPLHIFENRYRRMLLDIEGTKEKLLVLTNLDHHSNKPLEIGVLAKVISQETLADGRSNIIVECLTKVAITDYFRPYTSLFTRCSNSL